MREPKELILVRQLIDESKFDDAQLLISNFEEKGGHTLYDRVSCYLLKCELLLRQGLYEDLVKFADQAYKESLELGKNFLSVDILLIMANALLWLKQYDKLQDVIKQGEELLQTLAQEIPADYKRREAYLAWIKGRFYVELRDADRALEHLEHSLELREEYGTTQDIIISLGGLSNIYVFFQVDYNQAIEILERSKILAEKIGDKWCLGQYYLRMAIIYNVKGELDRSIELSKQGLTVFNDINNQLMVATILCTLGEVYRQKGELDRALECLEQALALRYERGNPRDITEVVYYLIQLLIDKGDLEQAQQYLQQYEQLNKQLKDKELNLVYLLNKALILKKSSRTRKRAEAEEILTQILEDKDSNFELILTALTNLCDLLFTELRMTNDAEVLEEINPLIARLLDIAEKTGSHSILCEVLLLQAKLSLLNFDIEMAQRFLIQAQQIVKTFGLNLLAKKITTEKEDLFNKLDLWENLKKAGASMADRLELARVDEKIIDIVYNSAILTPQVTEEQVSISKEKRICLVCRGDVLKFSYICDCGAIYCENCARALVNLGNTCWLCNVPIDYSKPVKEFKEEAKSIKNQTIVKKK
ncbi:MAG: tetratricopeptide repeat protein [Promethearchaeota archaeon]